jgi:hypothetical protein
MALTFLIFPNARLKPNLNDLDLVPELGKWVSSKQYLQTEQFYLQ